MNSLVRIFVAAGSYPEYLEFLEQQPIYRSHFTYLHAMMQLAGTENPLVITTGTWYARPEFRDLRSHVLSRWR